MRARVCVRMMNESIKTFSNHCVETRASWHSIRCPPGVQLWWAVLQVPPDVVAPVAKPHIGGSNSEIDLEPERGPGLTLEWEWGHGVYYYNTVVSIPHNTHHNMAQARLEGDTLNSFTDIHPQSHPLAHRLTHPLTGMTSPEKPVWYRWLPRPPQRWRRRGRVSLGACHGRGGGSSGSSGSHQ